MVCVINIYIRTHSSLTGKKYEKRYPTALCGAKRKRNSYFSALCGVQDVLMFTLNSVCVVRQNPTLLFRISCGILT